MPYPRYIRAFLFLLISLLVAHSSSAQFVTQGGETSFEFLDRIQGPEGKLNRYRITAKLFKECADHGSAFPGSIKINVARTFNPGSQMPYIKLYEVNCEVDRLYTNFQMPNDCSPLAPLICYQVGVYKGIVTLPEVVGEYIIYVQDMIRNDDHKNVITVLGAGVRLEIMGFTYPCYLPGGLPAIDPPVRYSSPVFRHETALILCAGKSFRYDFSAVDPDGDSLSYRFVPAYKGKIQVGPRATDGTASWPPFSRLPNQLGYTPEQPFGTMVLNAATLDSVTGMLSGQAPPFPGYYLVTVEVGKYRNGQLLGRHRKETKLLFLNCTWPNAELDTTYRNCSGTNIHFLNYSTGDIASYSWDFGDPATNADTSHLAEPVYSYSAPGVYTAKLWINKGTNLCKDSTTCKVIVDTGLNASFTAQRSLDVCNIALYDFTNRSTEGANPITSQAWDFGEMTTSADISSALHPSYTYPTDGDKKVRLIVKNSIGCSDTAFKIIKAFKNVMQAPNDTTICIRDSIRLQPNTNGFPGDFSWSPVYNLNGVLSPAPLVWPRVDTTYYVVFTDTTGCIAIDSVKVKVRDTAFIKILQADTTICTFDSIRLLTEHYGLSVTWQPTASIIPVVPNGSEADASPNSSTDVIATAHFGSCFGKDTMHIKVVAPPQVTVNNDTTVCLGAPVKLQANGGTFYLWTPAATLSNAAIAGPVAHPIANTIYTVSVYDTLGCPKHTMATVKVGTFRGLIAVAERDTLVVEGEPVQLKGSGGQYYQWSPPQFLSNPSIANPIARTYGDVFYTMKITNDDNCVDSAKVRIRAFKDPDIYVPTAFTPNNDGRNDLFKVFPVGFTVQELKIFDRWGNVVFVTSDPNKGWDGRSKGETLATGTFIWTASGIDKKTGKTVFKKGNITLIR